MGLQSLTTTVAVPTAADAWTAMTNVRVPAGAKRVSRITVGLAPDPGTSATSIRMAPAFRIQGSGLGEQSPHNYLGPFGGWATVTDGTQSIGNNYVSYEVDIPVQVGSDIECAVNTLDEAVTAGTTKMELEFDTERGPSQANSMADFVDAAVPSAADAWAALGTLNVPTAAQGRQPTKIIGISIGVGVDSGTSAISLRTSPRVRLSGAGLKDGAAALEFTGPDGCSAQVTAGSSGWSNQTRFIDLSKTPIHVNSAGQIVVEQRYDVETPTAVTTAVGVLYA